MARLKQVLEKYQFGLILVVMGFSLLIYSVITASETGWRYIFAATFLVAGLYHGWQQFRLTNGAEATPGEDKSRAALYPKVNLKKTGRHGTVTEKLGDAFYGNSQVYTADLYYGRASKGAKLYLVDDRVFQSNHKLPIIKVRITAGGADGFDSDMVDKVGWLSLTATSFVDFYDPATKTINVYGPNQTGEATGVETTPDQPETVPQAIDAFRTAVDDYHAAYGNVISQGSGAFEALLEMRQADDAALATVATKLMRDIGQQSLDEHQPALDRLICPQCYAHFTLQTLQISSRETIDYCACRRCGQSQQGLTLHPKGQVIALLDGRSQREFREQGDDLLVNWSVYRQMFDFTAVKITWASDEDVERFVVQINNRAKADQRKRYRKMDCSVAERCRLSENSYRILRRTFGRVEVS